MTLLNTFLYFLDLSYTPYVGMLRRTMKEVVVKISETVASIDLFSLCFTKNIFQEA